MQQKCSYYCNILSSKHWVRFIPQSSVIQAVNFQQVGRKAVGENHMSSFSMKQPTTNIIHNWLTEAQEEANKDMI